MAKDKTFKLAAKLATVSGGTTKARVGLKIEREELGLQEAMHLFLGAEVRWRFVWDPNAGKDAEGQETIPGQKLVAEGTGQIQSFHMYPDHYSASLSIMRGASKIDDPLRLSGNKGTLTLCRIGDANPEPEGPDDAEE